MNNGNGDKAKSLLHFFLRRKPVMMLVKLKNDERPRYASLLAKEVDCTYSHTVRILQILEDNGFIAFDKRGRLKLIKLTSLGMETGALMEQLIRLFNKSSDTLRITR